MSASKSIIMKDQSCKKWQREDYDDHWEDDPLQAIGIAIAFCIGITIALVVAIVGIVLFYGPSLELLK